MVRNHKKFTTIPSDICIINIKFFLENPNNYKKKMGQQRMTKQNIDNIDVNGT